MKAQGQSIDDVPFKAVLGVWGSWFGLILNILCVIAQFYIAVFPIGGTANAYDFFVNMLAMPIILVCFIGWKLLKGTRVVRLTEIDLVTGRREMDLAAAKREEMEERATWPLWKKYIHFLKAKANLQSLLLFVLGAILVRNIDVWGLLRH
jgi:yeast amino acid transporter